VAQGNDPGNGNTVVPEPGKVIPFGPAALLTIAP